MLVYDVKENDIKLVLLKAANNLIFNNSQAILKEIELVKIVVKITDTLLDSSIMLSEEDQELGRIGLIFMQTAFQQPSSNKLHKMLTDEFNYDRLLKFLKHNNEEIVRIALLILQNSMYQNLDSFFEQPDSDRITIFGLLKSFIGVGSKSDTKNQIESPLTLTALKCLSIISQTTIMAQKEFILDKQIVERLLVILSEPHERVIFGEEKINTILFDIQAQILTLIKCLTFKFSEKQSARKTVFEKHDDESKEDASDKEATVEASSKAPSYI